MGANSRNGTSGTSRVRGENGAGGANGSNGSDGSDGENDRIKIYTVGVGTAKGGLVPVYDDAGSMVTDYMKDVDGNHVISRLNPDTLQLLANEGNGAYYQAAMHGIDAKSLILDFSTLQRDEYKTERIMRHKQLYQYFLGAGLLLFLLAWFLPETGKRTVII
jgi:Ca-activated chloride channel family protein